MKTVYDKIKAGAYENAVEYPSRSAPNRAERQMEYRKGQMVAEARFKADLEEEFGLSGHPKAQRLFDLAWQEGHSSGYNEVLNYYSEFSDLLK